MKKLLLTAIVGTLMCGNAFAEKWYLSGLDEEQMILVDLDSIAEHKGETRGWTAFINVDKKLPYDLQMTMFHIKCSEGTMAFSATYNYLKGKLKETANNKRQDIGYPPPGSIADAIGKILCKPKSVNKDWITNIKDIKEETQKLQEAIRLVGKNVK